MFISFASYCLITNCNSNFCIDVTKESNKIRTKPSSNEDSTEIKLEPDDLNDSMVDASEQIENKSDSSELSQNVEIFDEHLSGNFYYKIQYCNCLNLIN